MNDPEEYNKKMRQLEQNVIMARGHVLQRCVELEMAINIYLATHFGKNEESINNMLSYIFCTNRMTFDSKLDVFIVLVAKYHSEFIKNKPKYKEDLKEIVVKRNHFAHLYFDITPAGLNKKGVVSLAKWKKDKVELINYKHEEINSLVDLIYDYTEEIGKLTGTYEK